jgi:hypothetical protein
MKSDELKSVVQNMRQDISNGTFDENNYTEFKAKSKILYDMVINPESFNQEIFDKFMGYLKRLENGEDPYGVDIEVGKFMAKKYVDPVVSKLPPPPRGS